MFRFTWSWPSLVVECLAGVLLASAVQPVRGVPMRFAIATAGSAFYERVLDRNGWSWRDVGQPELGIAGGLAAWKAVR